jgi:23S rRNA maturation-related 3'-5' exoribonuclease YhaM
MRRIGIDKRSEIKSDEVIIEDPLVKFIEGDIAAQKKKNSLNIISHTNDSYSLKSTVRKREDSYNEQREYLDECVQR